ncbi:MAG TPA: enolase C-terminal domain-like protein [Gammaproteobacteria bacterium]|jgi:muconate cycloisomerase
MRVKSCELIWLRTPFKQSFSHARATRHCSDKILVLLNTCEGVTGFGEILARGYVSGETNDSIFNKEGPGLASEVVGRSFASLETLLNFIKTAWFEELWGTALLGGFELALLNAYAQLQPVNINRLLGPRRVSPPGNCATLGFECADEQIRRYVIQAKLIGATVIKVKVGLANDIERLCCLNSALKGRMPIRLDANGSLSLEQAIEMLVHCQRLPIQSLEQPFAADDPQLEEKLAELLKCTHVPLMADESLCTPTDLNRWLSSRVYQIFNIRVGKCGGLVGSIFMRDAALLAGLDIVAGTMVGESGVLNRASELLLTYSESLPYVEGLGQHKSLLMEDPVAFTENKFSPLGGCFELREDAVERQLIKRMKILE